MRVRVLGLFFHLSVNAPRSNPEAWGDTRFAMGLAAAIRSFPDCEAGLIFRGEAPPATDRPAVLLRIIGPHLEEPVPGIPNMVWIISPPNLAPQAMLARYQAVFYGSQVLTRHSESRGHRATCLLQATDAAHFHPGRRPAGAAEIPLLFVGGYAPRVDRRLVLESVRAGFEPQIWGPGWKGVIPDRLWQGERIEHDALAALYASARVILNSHMARMAMLGFMSNRSYDALASGALVVSDQVAGFTAPDLPELTQVGDLRGLRAALDQALSAPALTPAERLSLNVRLAAGHGFAARAAVLVEAARDLQAQGRIALPAFRPAPPPGAASGRPAEPTATADAPAAALPASGTAALEAAATRILALCSRLESAPAPEPAGVDAPEPGIIHALMPDLREIRAIARLPADARPTQRIEEIACRSRRVQEALAGQEEPLGLRIRDQDGEQLLARILQNEPLWPFSPEGFARDGGKANLPLWPRRQTASPSLMPAVFLHLYYDELAPVFAARLAAIESPFALYVSTDTEEKAGRIRASLPGATIRVFGNRGRDIWPKLYGFRDVYARHSVVLHLHGKRSTHSGKLDEWLDHILACLIGSAAEVNRILSFFETMPRLGMVVPVPYRAVLGAAHWGANQEIARELAWRMGQAGPLPDDNALRFPVGSMFWARSEALRPLLDLNLEPGHFPPEAGQVDGTPAHAIERMLGVTCRAGGYHILPVTGAGAVQHRKHQKRFDNNGALRAALDAGLFDG